ncbi:hypothetical protein EVAR_37553_1 [Eumeta japonica]|uniref:Uncharacterized protein n=1 Tax=Eumeta variegata TaxID=151549 RepID=A0A4C1XQF7_EUMVA|nr:hypothetical protein EVAR_37553_1 [Eumeta japonica]
MSAGNSQRSRIEFELPSPRGASEAGHPRPAADRPGRTESELKMYYGHYFWGRAARGNNPARLIENQHNLKRDTNENMFYDSTRFVLSDDVSLNINRKFNTPWGGGFVIYKTTSAGAHSSAGRLRLYSKRTSRGRTDAIPINGLERSRPAAAPAPAPARASLAYSVWRS